MGLPISPIFPDLIMTHLEICCLKELNEKFKRSPIFYFRFVDDICMCIESSDVETVLQVFNDYDSYLKFTCEIQDNYLLSFFGTRLSLVNYKIIYNWYSKLHLFGRLINFFSNQPKSLKADMIYNLMARAIQLLNKKFRCRNIEKVKNLLNKNSYPPSFSNH